MNSDNLEYSVVEMQPEDIEEVLQIWRETPGICLANSDDYDKLIKRFLLKNPGLSFLARKSDSGKIIGTLLAGTDGIYATLRHAVVLEKYRGRGIMSELMDAALLALKNNHIHEVFLYVLESNTSAEKYFAGRKWDKINGVKLFKKNI